MREARSVADVAVYGQLSRSLRRFMQSTLRVYMDVRDLLKIGFKNCFVGVDETIIGLYRGKGVNKTAKGIMKKRPSSCPTSSRRAQSKKISRRLPGRTIHKKSEGSVKKKPAMKRSASNDNDKRSWGVWLWCAITLGHGATCHSHGEGTKKFTFNLLPRSQDAPEGNTRGGASLAVVMAKHLHKGCKLVADEWTGTPPAARKAGMTIAGRCVHSSGFRNRKTGFHNNDIESENGRMKQFMRHRYGSLRFGTYSQLTNETIGDVYEYAYRTNVGDSFRCYMLAFCG